MTPTEKLLAHHEKLIGTTRALSTSTANDQAKASLLVSFCNGYFLTYPEVKEATLDNTSRFYLKTRAQFLNQVKLEETTFSSRLVSTPFSDIRIRSKR
jgi:hypothetical protein